MKKFLTSCVFGLAAGGLIAAEVACKINACDPRWSKSADGKAYTVKYDGKAYPMLDIPLVTTPDTFYKLTFEVDESKDPSGCYFRYQRLDPNKIAYCEVPRGTHKRTATHYFFSGNSKKGAIRFNMDPKFKNMVFTLRNLKIETVDSLADAGNLIPDPEFENDVVTDFWRNNKHQLLPFADAGFISGSRSLCFKADKNIRVFSSAGLPVTPGKTYEFTFFAKADKKCPFWVMYSMWSPFGHAGKHVWLKRDTGITTEWQEYKFTYTIPTDVRTYPDLAERIGTLSFALQKIDSATVYFDQMSFKEVK